MAKYPAAILMPLEDYYNCIYIIENVLHTRFEDKSSDNYVALNSLLTQLKTAVGNVPAKGVLS